MEKLSEKEIRKRLIEWKNLKVLHKKAIAKNKSQKERIDALEKNQAFLLDQIETLQLQLEEFRRMIFGRKKKKDDNDNDDDFRPKKEKRKPEP